MVSALLRGKDYPQEELVFTAHLFEGFAKQGANDDVSGCTAILETARTLKKLQDEGKIPPLKRSIRFLFVPEISGTSAYIKKFPDIAKRFFANINHDMVGEAIVKNHAYFCLVTTPYSLPSYLNDTIASFVEWIGKTQRRAFEYGDVPLAPIVSPTGTRDPFYYAIDRYSGGSDHVVFVDGSVRVPGVLLIVWPDMWYHSSGDLPDKSDSTQFKRVAFLSVAAGLFLANAGSAEAEKMLAETSARAFSRIGADKTKAERWIQNADKKEIVTAFKEARNVIHQAAKREKDALSSVKFFIKSDPGLEKVLAARLARVEDLGQSTLKEIDESYELRCAREKIEPQKPEPSKEEIRLSGVVPVRTKSMGDIMAFWQMRDKISQMKYKMPPSIRAAEFELRNFIDGKRTIAEIRDAVSAEYEPIPLADVENYMKFLEKLGMVEIKNR
jgi:aminopeptidase YwaD